MNVISPIPIETPGLLGLAADAEQEQQLCAGLIAAVPLGRLGRLGRLGQLGQPDELANLALFLVSDEASLVNGAELFVDCGEVQF